MKSRKIFAAAAALLLVFSFVFAGCSEKVNEITTDNAVIKEDEAVDLIKSYSTAELGLSSDWSDYNFAGYNNSGVKVEDSSHDGYYVEVRIGNKIENDDGTLDFDIVGHYLISYDGKTILKYDPVNETYTPLSEITTSAAQEQQTNTAEEKTSSQSTTAKAEK